jgi:hypothetical protein
MKSIETKYEDLLEITKKYVDEIHIVDDGFS